MTTPTSLKLYPMTSKPFGILTIAILILSACGSDGERFSFTLPFSISPSEVLSVNDTISITSVHGDSETNYYSGSWEFISSKYFDTELTVLELGDFGDATNCRLAQDAVEIIAIVGEATPNLLRFAHQGTEYSIALKVVPKRAGAFALLLNDTEEIRKVFTDNFNRHILNDFNIYELALLGRRIPIDERVSFIEVE